MILTQEQNQILIGHLLGDGCLNIGSRGKNATFRIVRTYSDIEYLKWSFNYFKDFINYDDVKNNSYHDFRTDKTYNSCSFRTRSYSRFTELYGKWYINGKKQVPRDLILSPLTAAVWFADDGSIQKTKKNTVQIKLATHGFVYNDVVFLSSLLEDIVHKVHIYKEKDKSQWTLRIFGKSAKLFLRYIDKSFPPLNRKSDIWRKADYILIDKPKAPNCLKCDSDNTYFNGKLKGNLKQKYFCLNCRINFFDIRDYKTKPRFLTQNQWHVLCKKFNINLIEIKCKVCDISYEGNANLFFSVVKKSGNICILRKCKICQKIENQIRYRNSLISTETI